MSNRFCLFTLTCTLLAADTAQSLDGKRTQSEFFENRIRPILVNHCYECHGPDTAEGKLRLDVKTGWQRGGESGPTIVPGDPASSLLIQAVTHQDPRLKMPPKDSGGKLAEQQIKDLGQWVRDGAFDPRTGDEVVTDIEAAARNHWAFQPLPPVTADGVGQNPIDRLIDHVLSEKNITPTPPADIRTLIRRATFDLHGLPPTEQQLQTPPEQFPQLVRDLLASPRYGERWGRHWLDVARYSDAKDGVLMYGDARIRPFAYTYRDYVIRAFNDDKPFDEFIREQIAADKLGLPEDSPALAGMGLLTLGRMFDNNRHDVIDDQIDVVTRGFLGLTVSCARCHDHKFDPVPTADYYSLYGIFASSIEPYERPRIEAVTDTGKAFESEYADKLAEVFALQQSHYDDTLKKAAEKTPEYLVQVATTEPDVAETSIFFLSLIPNQLRPQITARWRRLIARRAFPDDPIFGPWHDMMQKAVLRPTEWKQRGIDQRVIDGLVAADPKTPAEIAETYGHIIQQTVTAEKDCRHEIAEIEAELKTLDGGAISLADIVAGGNGFGTGVRGNGISPANGNSTTQQTGFIAIHKPDQAIAVPDNRFVDSVFVPMNDTVTVSSTGLQILKLKTSGKTWDHFRFGPSSGFSSNTIDGVDYSKAPHRMLSMHANKGITFDLKAIRDAYDFDSSRFQTLFGHGGAKGESRLNFSVFVDGVRVHEHLNFPAQGKGLPVDISLPADARFLTLVTTEGSDGISHDQAILGDPQIVPDKSPQPIDRRRQRLVSLNNRRTALQKKLDAMAQADDPLRDLLTSRNSPIWFPKRDIYYYLSRTKKDAYRGLIGQLDAIAVKNKNAPARAMVVVDSEQIYDPVIFQRGDPGARGTPVPRRFLKALSPANRAPFGNGSGRLELANAIASADNPLTARVWANRVWMHHFGKSLVENPGDFGLRTPRPVHHKLLDYLAAFLIQNKWSTKSLHELIMSSKAWQRASRIPETERMRNQLNADPENIFFWHANRRRLDFEQMRDTLLEVSGLLDLTMFGRPPLITDEANNRRTVYAFVERQNIPAIVQTFDFANADTSTAQRVTTTVPQQALFAMNSNFMNAASKALAARVTAKEPTQQISQLYRFVYRRQPDDYETKFATEFLGSNSLQQLAQVLLMSNELMFVD